MKQEIAAVPEVTFRHVGCGDLGIGLLDECLDRAH
jgi:hypothetical protein